VSIASPVKVLLVFMAPCMSILANGTVESINTPAAKL